MRFMPDRFKTPNITHVMGQREYPVLALPVLIVWLITTWLAFDYGRGRAGYDSGEAAVRVGELRDEIKVLDKEREQLKRRIAALERQDQVYKEAELQMKNTMVGYQDAKLKLEKEVLFLRGVISGRPGKAQLRVHNLKTSVDKTTGDYRLQFTIDQSMAGKRRVEGDAKVSLTGVDKNGKEITLAMGDIAKGQALAKMGFLHFQKLDESFKLPDGFKPSHWRVELSPGGEDIEGLNERFEWRILD
ncbi:MAG: DivIVA domain-containing protein [Gammaproteobacteria bacterium]|nr:DivIVA domain-containing protein [Gammaproteobacteria bacterium]MBU1656387.1 DivIVA domain-containing protein [Gammaproteobacteria bacterium]MBU1960935.1 DivIVA domain-containing protein [Gammaproteobacteria bacterium]